MSSSKAALPNDEYAWIDRYAADLHKAARDLARDGEAARVSDEAVAQLLTAAIRLLPLTLICQPSERTAGTTVQPGCTEP